LLGVFTDGDLRRALEKRPDINEQPIDAVMSTQVKTIAPDTLAAEALHHMEHNRISALVVCDATGQICGVVQLLGLLRAGLA